ncbi:MULTISPECIES: phage major capsid protein [unclassified Bradyrhizobium]|uniref:phage major capsid protein n=1 Tax=unclassified Bradyrhizobium TaxID=2631580 RepID=UPI0029165CB6|nr:MULTISPECIES: phage major capsid protein [unclassified Bradyrhizobium]
MKKDLKKLRQARAEKAKLGKTRLEALNALLAKETLTEAEGAQLATLEAEVDTLEKEVAALDAEIASEEKSARRASLFASTASAAAIAIATLGGPALATVVNDTDPARTGGFKSLPEFAVAVRNLQVQGIADPRFAAAATGYQQNQGSSGEGVLVPTEWREAIWSLVFADNDLLGFCNPEPTQGNTVGIIKDETTPWGAAGVQAAWRSEGTQMLASKAALTPTIMQLHELYAFVLASQEVLDDAPRLQNRLTIQAARAIRWKAFEAVMWGDGNGKPLGFMKSPALITVAAEGGQTAGTIVPANVLKMMARLFEMDGGSPQFIANRDTLPQLGTLQIGNNAAWLPMSQALAGGGIRKGGMLLGEQLTYNEHCQTIGTTGDIVLADLSGYALATKQGGGIDFAASIHLFFDQNIQAFRWIFRVGGQPYLSAPVVAAKGANSKSHFIALASR